MTDLPDPPRHIPLNAAVTGLFAGTGCQVSWLLTGLLTVFLVVFAFDSSSFLLARGDTALVSGEIVERRETVLSDTVVGRGGIIHRRGEPVYRYGYRYAVGGSTHLGSSFGHEKDLETTAQLTIEYLKARPCVSRIQGMAAEPRLGGGRTPLIIVLTILLIAVASVTLITRRRLLGFRLARNGVAAQARAANTTLLSRTHHGREWYQIEWEYEVGGRQHALLQRPHYTEHVEPDEQRTVLYDPKRPEKSILLEDISAFVGGQAGINALTGTRAIAIAAIPCLATIAVVVSLYLEFSC